MSWQGAQPPINMSTDSGPGISLHLLNKQNPVACLKQESLSWTPLLPAVECVAERRGYLDGVVGAWAGRC